MIVTGAVPVTIACSLNVGSRRTMKHEFSDSIPRTRAQKGEVPQGFEAVYVRFPSGEKVRYRCLHETRGIDGLPRQCVVFFRKSEIPRVHLHQYLLPAERDPCMRRRRADADESEEIPTVTELNRKLETYLAEIAGQLDISVHKITSEPMLRFVRRVVSLGFTLKQMNPGMTSVPAGVTIHSREVLARRIMDVGECKRQKNMLLMR